METESFVETSVSWNLRKLHSENLSNLTSQEQFKFG